ncbi:hypothetical protein BUE80_DR012844 [Diplocarpon rosae]|nr:hypothetical protein BUE80_DR012844 [Diplocarpon rosae]
MPLAKDTRFRKDREDFSGRSWDEADRERRRQEALVDVRDAFELLETKFLADGRDWILEGEGPSLGDIEGSAKQHRDRGRLVGLSAKEVVLETEGQGTKSVRIHTPRRGFRVRRLQASNL